MSVVTLVSFDIDGTLEIGDPPGIIGIAAVRAARRLGYVVGSCSDRPLAHQRRLWHRLELNPDFTVLKHRLAEVRAAFTAAAYCHIGDTDVDEHFAGLAGFRFLRADAVSFRVWGPELFGLRDRGIEGRHGSAGAARVKGGLGAMSVSQPECSLLMCTPFSGTVLTTARPGRPRRTA